MPGAYRDEAILCLIKFWNRSYSSFFQFRTSSDPFGRVSEHAFTAIDIRFRFTLKAIFPFFLFHLIGQNTDDGKR